MLRELFRVEGHTMLQEVLSEVVQGPTGEGGSWQGVIRVPTVCWRNPLIRVVSAVQERNCSSALDSIAASNASSRASSFRGEQRSMNAECNWWSLASSCCRTEDHECHN